MKVFLAAFDLFNNIGGGQSFYREAIKTNPNIEFYYPVINEDLQAKRPANSHAIQLILKFPSIRFDNDNTIFKKIPGWCHYPISDAANIAYSIKNYDFDIIDIPDWEQYGPFMREFLEIFNVKFKKIALSMHGNLSNSLKGNWQSENTDHDTIIFLEKSQYFSSDIRYGISDWYLNQWDQSTGIPNYYLNPLHIFRFSKNILYTKTSETPSLLFLGRTEKIKGPDIFVNLIWNTSNKKINNPKLIGPSVCLKSTTTTDIISALITKRGIDVQILPPIKSHETINYFQTSHLTIIPSRFDTFNLVALESVFSGCPTIISDKAGIVEFFKKELPELPLRLLPIDSQYKSIEVIENVIDEYDKDREIIKKIITDHSFNPDLHPTLLDIYASPAKPQNHNRLLFHDLCTEFVQTKPKEKSLTHKITQEVLEVKNALIKKTKFLAKKRNYKSFKSWEKFFVSILGYFPRTFRKYLKLKSKNTYFKSQCIFFNNILMMPEDNKTNINQKIKMLFEFSQNFKFGKAIINKKIADLYILLDNHLLSAVYLLRSLKLGSKSTSILMNQICQSLSDFNFNSEKYIVNLIYSKSMSENCFDYLEKQRKTLSVMPKYSKNYFVCDDNRKKNHYQVSIIVSLYNSANKLNFFLKSLARQTILKRNEAEIILIDSNSPSNEREILVDCQTELKLDVLYIKTKARESIQKAWNRGIIESRGTYLCFLGVDEGLTPEGLDILASELDTDSTIDWVQSNSLMTNVSANGTWVDDVMLYDRRNFHPFHIYLDTCYISYVGALYKKSIHEKFGYYDDSFRAAGDTEFKNRVGPFIKTKTIPKTLGIFYNYAEDRTTQSPAAEIEDLRAWYLFRTEGGIKYIFQNKSQNFVEEALLLSLNYRKSYCNHLSTDFSLACLIFKFLRDHFPNSLYLNYYDLINEINDCFNSIDNVNFNSPQELKLLDKSFKTFKYDLQKMNVGITKGNKITVSYSTDNRYEQHNGLW